MTGNDYALATTCLWVGIIVGELPANRAVQVLPLGKLLGASMMASRALHLSKTQYSSLHSCRSGELYAPVYSLPFQSSSLTVIDRFSWEWLSAETTALSWCVPPLDACYLVLTRLWQALRFILGVFEAVVGPCLLAITVQWWKKTEQVRFALQRRLGEMLTFEQPLVLASWQCMLGVNSTVSGLFGFGQCLPSLAQGRSLTVPSHRLLARAEPVVEVLAIHVAHHCISLHLVWG